MMSKTTGVSQRTAIACVIVGLAFVPWSRAANATPFSYNEVVSGDLPELSPRPVLPFSLGANTIVGTQFIRFIGGVVAIDYDPFNFTIPVGDVLSGVSYQATLTTQAGTPVPKPFLDTFIDLMVAPSTYILAAHETIDITQPGVLLAGSFDASLPLGAGEYLLFEGQIGLQGQHQHINFGQDAEWGYAWTFDVTPAPVPEPSTLALLAVGLLGVFALSRQRRVPCIPKRPSIV